MRQLLGALIALIFCVPIVHAQIIINEVSPRSDPEWVELYNQSEHPVDLTTWYLQDLAGKKESLSNLGIHPPQTYLVFTRAKGWLNDTSQEHLYLFDGISSDPLDSLAYSSIKEGLTLARLPNLTGEWFSDQNPSLGFANPEPTLEPSPSPSSSPSPTPIPTPPTANTPTPKPSVSSPVPVYSPNQANTWSIQESHPSDSLSQQAGSVAGDSTNVSSISSTWNDPILTAQSTREEASSPPVEISQTSKNPQIKTAISLVLGLTLVATSLYLSYRKFGKPT